MSVIPGFINSSGGVPSYDAAGLRLIESVDLTPDSSATGSLGVRTGVRPSFVGSFEVSIAGGVSIDVAPGYAVLGKISGAQGGYRVAMDTAFSTPITARDATYSRKDAVYLQVRDTDVDGLGFRDGMVGVAVGAPSATPVEPAVPDGAMLLGVVTVPPTGGGSITVEDRRVFTVAAGGILPVDGQPTNPYAGQAIFRTDSGALEVFNGTEWVAYATAERATLRLRLEAAETRANGNQAPLDWVTEEASGGASLDLEGGTNIILPPGLWDVSYQVSIQDGDVNSNAAIILKRNGANVTETWVTNNGAKDVSATVARTIRITEGDVLVLDFKNNNSATAIEVFAQTDKTWLTAYRIGE